MEEIVNYLYEVGDEQYEDIWLSKVQEYISSGGDIDEKLKNNGWSLLHVAAENCCPKVVDKLVTSGANINLQDSQGWTPLMLALDSDMQDSIQNSKPVALKTTEVLLKHGADKTITSNDGTSFINLAQEYGVLNELNTKNI